MSQSQPEPVIWTKAEIRSAIDDLQAQIMSYIGESSVAKDPSPSNWKPKWRAQGGVRLWRLWKVDGKELYPIHYNYCSSLAWLPGENRAVCGCSSDACSNDPLVYEYQGGFYGYSSPSQAFADVDACFAVIQPGFIFGTMVGYGRMVEHQYGWRAQYARVEALSAPPPASQGILEVISETYGVPVLDRDDLCALPTGFVDLSSDGTVSERVDDTQPAVLPSWPHHTHPG